MGFTRKYIKDRNFVLTLIRDAADNRKLEEHIHALTIETKDMRPFLELADASELHDLSGFTEEGIAFAASIEFERKPFKRDRLAILISNDEAYRLASMYRAISNHFRYDVEVFRDFMDAVTWLSIDDLIDEINDLRKA